MKGRAFEDSLPLDTSDVSWQVSDKALGAFLGDLAYGPITGNIQERELGEREFSLANDTAQSHHSQALVLFLPPPTSPGFLVFFVSLFSPADL